MKTKERVLEAARRLFNEEGTGAVSTNHIAEAAGISPGNLYYHYRNKDDIIRALFERLFAEWDVRLNLPADRPPTPDDALALVRLTFEIMRDYRFAYRELLALLRADAALHARYVEVRSRGYAGFRAMIAALADVGGAPDAPDAATVERLADLCWLISEFWLASIEVSGIDADADADATERGVALMIQALRPYIAF